MSFLLDTNFVSACMKGDLSADAAGWLDRNERECFLSAITIAELERGVRLLPAGKKRTRLEKALDDFLEEFAPHVLDFSAAVATQWAELFTEAEKRGRNLPVFDSMIEATALHWDLTIVTRNTKDFLRAPTLDLWRVES